MHESQLHSASSFVTLTYDDDHVSTGLVYRDFQLFMKRLRKKFPKVRFFMCGEYGDKLGRPHFHACLFGVFFADRVPWKDLSSGFKLYRSKLLEELWPFGFSSVGDVSFDSAAYVARYCVKKVSGPLAKRCLANGDIGEDVPVLAHYERVDVRTGEIVEVSPEFAHMSLKPGVGSGWISKFKDDVYPGDYCIVEGHKVSPPKYYDNYLKSGFAFEYDELEFERYKKAQLGQADCTPARLAVQERVAKARLRFKVRVLE